MADLRLPSHPQERYRPLTDTELQCYGDGHRGVNNLPTVVKQPRPDRGRTRDLLIASIHTPANPLRHHAPNLQGCGPEDCLSPWGRL